MLHGNHHISYQQIIKIVLDPCGTNAPFINSINNINQYTQECRQGSITINIQTPLFQTKFSSGQGKGAQSTHSNSVVCLHRILSVFFIPMRLGLFSNFSSNLTVYMNFYDRKTRRDKSAWLGGVTLFPSTCSPRTTQYYFPRHSSILFHHLKSHNFDLALIYSFSIIRSTSSYVPNNYIHRRRRLLQ